MKAALEAHEGDPVHDAVQRFVSSATPTRIPMTKDVYAQIVEHGIAKKMPFAKKNGTADAAILFSTLRWAKRRGNRLVYFHTLNSADFSVQGKPELPHADLAHCFAPNTSVQYCYDVRELVAAVKPLDPLDFIPRRKDGCTICEGDVLIEHISCAKRGHWPRNAPDHEGYRLRRLAGGVAVDVFDHDGEQWRLECDVCGRRTFDVELSDLCSYHHYTASKDD
jgi:hypothetical protein